ncbi:MAG TPA: hypothetical protein VFY77_02325 [Nitrososphaeraceae archaeon]|nr:hypothetical protein [Nitrososphaeraceae archaeon]
MLILVLALSLFIIGGLLLDKVNAEEFLTPRSFFGGEESSLSTLINNALLGNVNSNSIDATISYAEGEEYQVIHSYQNFHSHLSTLINNALLGNVNSNSIDEIASDDVKEQLITIKEDGYNNNMIFEEPKKKMELLTSPVPFILPVPFP